MSAEEIRIVLIGKTGVGKSAAGNTILGQDVFHKAACSMSVTKECSLGTTVYLGKTIKVVDTPGLCDTELSEDELTQATVKCIDMSYPGPHVFLLVLAIANRFTAEEKKAVQQIQEIFGEGATRYTMILFTKGDYLEDITIDDYLERATNDLKALINKCNKRYHVFNNKVKDNSQVFKLLQKIQDMVQCNGGGCFTNSTYQLLEKYKKREAELQQKADAARREKNIREAELERLIRRMEQEQQRQRLREEQMHEQLMEQNHAMVDMLERMEIEKNERRKEERRQKALHAQAAEHQRMMALEIEELEHRRYMDNKEMKRKQKMENQRFKQDRQEMSMAYETKLRQLEEQKRLAEAEKEKLLKERIRKNKNCIIS